MFLGHFHSFEWSGFVFLGNRQGSYLGLILRGGGMIGIFSNKPKKQPKKAGIFFSTRRKG